MESQENQLSKYLLYRSVDVRRERSRLKNRRGRGEDEEKPDEQKK